MGFTDVIDWADTMENADAATKAAMSVQETMMGGVNRSREGGVNVNDTESGFCRDRWTSEDQFFGLNSSRQSPRLVL